MKRACYLFLFIINVVAQLGCQSNESAISSSITTTVEKQYTFRIDSTLNHPIFTLPINNSKRPERDKLLGLAEGFSSDSTLYHNKWTNKVDSFDIAYAYKKSLETEIVLLKSGPSFGGHAIRITLTKDSLASVGYFHFDNCTGTKGTTIIANKAIIKTQKNKYNLGDTICGYYNFDTKSIHGNASMVKRIHWEGFFKCVVGECKRCL